MRIITGKGKGKHLKFPKTDKLRPTSDKVKEAYFSIINPRIKPVSVFLDLFAGSGSIGIEAISRGVEKAVFVDTHTLIIEENIRQLGWDSQAVYWHGDALRFLQKNRSRRYDLIYVDPPYDKEKLYPLVLNLLSDFAILTPEGILTVEHRTGVKLGEVGHLKIWRTERYGDTSLTLYRQETTPQMDTDKR